MPVEPLNLLQSLTRPLNVPFDKEKLCFDVLISAIPIKLSEIHAMKQLLKEKGFLLELSKTKSVVEDPDDPKKSRLILLNDLYEKNQIPISNISLCTYLLKIDYSFWSLDQVIDLILPIDLERITSFETIGHIAHLNLTDEHMPFASDIGHVILDKTPSIRTVVTKIGEIDHQFRFFNMKVIAGSDDLIATVKESNSSFTFDYSKVYWNSRLEHEHRRLVSKFKPDQIICDLFAGVGPFSIPAAKKGCIVHANDLNPDSVHYLRINSSKNKVAPENLQIYQCDANDFIRHCFAILKNKKTTTHFIMNLPASSLLFLHSFVDLEQEKSQGDKTSSEIGQDITLFNAIVHCYLFVKSGECPIKMISNAFGKTLATKHYHHALLETDFYDETTTDAIIGMHKVRNVSPSKNMFCVSFRPAFISSSNKRPKQ